MDKFDEFQERRDGWRWHGGVLALYLAIAVVYTWPLAPRLTTHAVGPTELGLPVADAGQFHWNLWWAREALTERWQNPYRTDLLYAPEGTPLAFHTLALFVGLVSIPFQWFLPLHAVYNLYLLLTFVLAGHGAWLLVRALGGDRAGAFLAGVIFSFFTFHARGVAHLNISSYFWIAYCLWAWLGLLGAGGWRWRIRLALLQTALFLTSLHLLYMTVIAQGLLLLYVMRQQALRRGAARPCGPREARLTGAGALAALLVVQAAYHLGSAFFLEFCGLIFAGAAWWWLGRPGRIAWRDTLARAAEGALATLLLCAPFLALMHSANRGAEYGRTEAAAQVAFSADLLNFAAPPWSIEPLGPALKTAAMALSDVCYAKFDALYALEDKGLFPGLALYALLAVMLWRLRPLRRKGWLALAGCFAVLALGPFLKVYNVLRVPWLSEELIVLPGALLRMLPGGETLRAVDRFILPVILALAVFAGLNWRALADDVCRTARRRLALLAAVCALVIIEHHPGGLEMGRFAPPPLLARLAEYPGELSVTHAPQYTLKESGWNMCAQTVHRRPIQDGFVARLTVDGAQRAERYRRTLRHSTVIVNRAALQARAPNALARLEQELTAAGGREVRDGALAIWTRDEKLYEFLTLAEQRKSGDRH